MSKRFRIALSFAGEKRSFVAELAQILASKFRAEHILYDKYHTAEFAVSDLGIRLPDLYHNESDLVVVVACKDYEDKEWCGLEWTAIHALIAERKADDVMLCRFDRVLPKGTYSTAGWIELDHITPEAAAAFILERLAVNEGYPKTFYTVPAVPAPATAPATDWPDTAPALAWPVADHTDARDAFARLIIKGSPHRYLGISGPSEMGKSHLTNQFIANASTIAGISWARFDFKGSADVDSALRTFAEHLGVSTPKPGTGVTSQLAEIFNALRLLARPTLLIFDTFEAANDADRWVKETLLLSLLKASWLRVIIVGQKVPPGHGQPWAAVSAPPVALTAPTVQEWLDYGLPHKPALTLDFVQQAHDCCGGKLSLLAQLLGPI